MNYILEVFLMTMTIKRSFFAFAGLLLALVILSSCGTQPGTGTGSTPTQPTTPASSSSSDYGTGTTPTTSASTSGALIKTASVMVKGKSTTVLTDAKGMTLYYFTPDTATKIACTGTCADTWPPQLASGSSAPTADGSLPGTLSTLANPNGTQVLYNGHALYTFSGDTGPDQSNGQGVAGKWFVVTPDIAKLS
jgi:predicted lipoprotein with Yx(FWY)xxD motif